MFSLGNQRVHTLTAQGKYELRVDIYDFDGNKAYAKYSTFSIGDASTNYRLSVGDYSGNAGELYFYQNRKSIKINRDYIINSN